MCALTPPTFPFFCGGGERPTGKVVRVYTALTEGVGWQSVNTWWLVSKQSVGANAGVFHTVSIKLLTFIHHSSYIQGFLFFLNLLSLRGLHGKRATVNGRYFPWGITLGGVGRGSLGLSLVGVGGGCLRTRWEGEGTARRRSWESLSLSRHPSHPTLRPTSPTPSAPSVG